MTKKTKTTYGADKIVKALSHLVDVSGKPKAVRCARKTCTNREYYRDLMRARRAWKREREQAPTPKSNKKPVKTSKLKAPVTKSRVWHVSQGYGIWYAMDPNPRNWPTRVYRTWKSQQPAPVIKRAIKALLRGDV